MKRWMEAALAAAVSLALCVLFGGLLLTYIKPMENRAYDLSLCWEGEARPENWVYDQKGWTFFTQEGAVYTELTANGNGSFSGLDFPGQTFYFSRIMEEDLDSPTLRLGTADRTFAVFLDGCLIYTDCPELDNRIGRLRPPMLEWYREEPITITLPLDYAGKILTIAQSTAVGQEFPEQVYPGTILLYCGYAYESRLIAESFQTAVPVSLAFAAGVILLALFVLQVFRGTPNMGTACGALLAFFWMAGRLMQVSFSGSYIGPLPIDVVSLSRNLSLTLLLAFLASRLTGGRRVLSWVFAAAQGAVAAAALAMELLDRVTLSFGEISPIVGLAGLLAILVCGALEWKANWFYHWFCPLIAAEIAICLTAGVWRSAGRITFGYLLWPLMMQMMAAALAVAVAEAVRREIVRRTELRLLARRGELAQSGYETMRRQHEQVMLLRHDMMKHVQLLRQMTGEAQVADYLDALIGQNEKIRPVVQSGNETLDIILNGKLSTAADAGIEVELVRTQAPEKLPMSDAELCSLFMNILDNALEAASEPGLEHPYIRLDLRVKNDFFVFCCKNSATLRHIRKEAAPGRGLGLKIMEQITARYDNLLETEHGADYYSVTLAIPLH